MLVPKMLFVCILNERGLTCFPKINIRSVHRKRGWENATQEQKDHIRESCRRGIQRYWDKTRQETINKMLRSRRSNCSTPENLAKQRESIKHADKILRSTPKFVKKQANAARKALKQYHASKSGIIIEEVERINTYSGVLTESQLRELED